MCSSDLLRKNQTDIFTFGVVGHKLTNITNDKFLDLHPCFSANNEFIIFSSNRKGDILYEESQVFSHNKTNDLFLYNYKTESPKLLRLTNTPEINETNPKPIKDNLYWFLADENGLNNRFSVKIDSVKVETDTSVFYQKNFTISDRKSTRLNSSHKPISYAVFCLKKKKTKNRK